MSQPSPLNEQEQAELVAYLDGELAGEAARKLETLNERQRMAVVLNKFEDMNYAEIAEVMNLTTKAVKSLLSRARMTLRSALTGYVYMDGERVPEGREEDE